MNAANGVVLPMTKPEPELAFELAEPGEEVECAPRPLAERITWSVAVWGLFIMLAVMGAMLAKPVLIPIALGFIIAATLSPLTRRLHSAGLPPTAAAGIVMVTLVTLLAIAVYSVLLPAWSTLGELIDPLMAIWARLQEWLLRYDIDLASKAVASVLLVSSEPGADSVLRAAGKALLTALPGFALTVATSLLLAFFMLAFGTRFMNKLVRMLPTVHDKVGALRIVRAVQRDLGAYLGTVTVINIGLAVAVSLLTWQAGFPVPLFWGALLGLLNFIPFAGPALGLSLMALAGLVFLATPLQAAILTAAMAGVFLIEGQILSPLLVGQRLKLNPLVVFIAFLFWGWLWGLFGMLLAIPLVIVVKKFADRFPGWKPVASFLAR